MINPNENLAKKYWGKKLDLLLVKKPHLSLVMYTVDV